MPRISQESIEAIKQQVNLVDVVAPYVQLKRAGRSWKGLSPFSQEKTPSFYVHPDRGFYKCFSSGEGGDLFTFIMKMENLEFAEAIEFLAKRFNIELRYEEGGPSREEVSLRKQLFDLHEIAADWFHRQFLKSDEAGPVRKYWEEERGFSTGTAREYKIGYAPVAADALARHVHEKGITPAALHKSGLFFARENEKDPRNFKSRFRGRLLIPIRDVQGRIVAFTGRKLAQTPEDDPAREAKYINSPETPVFHKSQILFGLDHARAHIREGGNFLLVEGQLDALRCWTVGLHTAIAPQGTSITEDQLYLLRRYDPGAVECLLDGDEAGRKAALRVLPMAFKAGLEFRFLPLPEKTDPDDLLRTEGADALQTLRANALDGITLSLRDQLPKGRNASAHEKNAALQSVFQLILNLSSEVAREDSVHAAARQLGVNPVAALRDFQQAKRARHPRAAGSGREAHAAERNSQHHNKLLTQAAWELLWLVLHFPTYAGKVSEIIDYEWIDTSSTAGRLLGRLTAELSEGLIEDPRKMDHLVETDEERRLLADIHTRELNLEDPGMQIQICLQTLYRNSLNARKKELEQTIANSDPSEDSHLTLMREVSEIRKALRKPIPIEIG